MQFHALRTSDLNNPRLFANRQDMLKSFEGRIDTFIEIGVAFGHLSRFVLDHFRPKKMHLVDIFTIHQYKTYMRNNTAAFLGGMTHRAFIEHKFAKEISDGTVFLHEGDSSTILSTFDDGYADCIYVDGDHSLEGVQKDTDVAHKKVAPRGYLVFNDYVLYCEEQAAPLGVVPVVNNLCAGGEWKVTHFAFHFMMFNDITLRRTA